MQGEPGTGYTTPGGQKSMEAIMEQYCATPEQTNETVALRSRILTTDPCGVS
jgi:hypothetical protein